MSGGGDGGGGGDGRRGCVLCGCADHRLIGCHRHAAKKCSCFGGGGQKGAEEAA